MRRVHFVVAILAMVLLTTNAAFAAQGRAPSARPASVGGPPTSVQGSRPASAGRPENPGRPETPGKSALHRPESSAQAADPTNTHGFDNYGQYVAATHVAENLNIDFNLLKMEMVDNKLTLGQAISKLRPELSSQSIEINVKTAEAAARKAEAEARKRKPSN